MNNKTFYVLLALVSGLSCILTIQVGSVITIDHLARLFFSQLGNILSSYIIFGIGIGLPLAIFAGTLSWLQLLLLLGGKIHPHLGKDGFINVINTLINKF